jgi:hypothetical protein
MLAWDLSGAFCAEAVAVHKRIKAAKVVAKSLPDKAVLHNCCFLRTIGRNSWWDFVTLSAPMIHGTRDVETKKLRRAVLNPTSRKGEVGRLASIRPSQSYNFRGIYIHN